jgi:hypothetical protein
MQLTTVPKVLVLGVLLLALAGCRDEDGGLFSSLGADPAQNNPPTISGSPKTTIHTGERYLFTPRASDPDDQALQFSVDNRPRWLEFDARTGRLSGTPGAGDVGEFGNVTIGVSDGRARRTLAPFAIRVETSTTRPPPVAPPDLPSAGGPFRFAEIPEIVFVRGYRESEQLGIFHLDTLNRWKPGDIDNAAGWRPRIATELQVVSGSLTGVRYDPDTGVLSYDGSGAGTETARAKLAAGALGVSSAEFNVRVLAPTLAWGDGAAQRFPGIGYDSSNLSWQEVRKKLRTGASYADPNVMIIMPGRYAGQDFWLQPGMRHLYILGEPGTRPVLDGDGLTLDGLETAYLKNLELDGTTVSTAVNLPEANSDVYVTRVYQHDSRRDDNGFKASQARPDAGITWRYWFWNFQGAQMGWKSNMRHQFYIEGRLDSRLIINNIRINGAKECSAIKTVRPFVSIRNSYLSAVLDEQNLSAGMRADKTVDVASAAEVVVYNNELVGAFSNERWGVSNGLLFWHTRRTFWSSDSPIYPNLSWDPPQSSMIRGFAPPGFTAGPETFVDPAFWDAVRSYDIADPANPYSFKKYVAYNRFRWLRESDRRQSVFRDDGTAPRAAAYQGSAEEIWGTAPSNWTERSVTFFANNRYEGWTVEDLSDPRRWFHLDFYQVPSLVTKHGPGPWPYPPPPRPVVFVGGEQRPGEQPSPVEIPDWFRL